jgi:nucleoid DNA-binding protein
MTRSDLVRLLAERRKLDVARAENIMAVLRNDIGSALRRGERFEVRGFGTFSVRRR